MDVNWLTLAERESQVDFKLFSIITFEFEIWIFSGRDFPIRGQYAASWWWEELEVLNFMQPEAAERSRVNL